MRRVVSVIKSEDLKAVPYIPRFADNRLELEELQEQLAQSDNTELRAQLEDKLKDVIVAWLTPISIADMNEIRRAQQLAISNANKRKGRALVSDALANQRNAIVRKHLSKLENYGVEINGEVRMIEDAATLIDFVSAQGEFKGYAVPPTEENLLDELQAACINQSILNEGVLKNFES